MDISICLRIDKLIEEMNGYCPHSNHWIYFTSSGYLSRGVTYDNEGLGTDYCNNKGRIVINTTFSLLNHFILVAWMVTIF